MDFALSEERQEVQDLARKILGDLATNERLKELDARSEGFDPALWKQLAEANLLGVAVGESWGGSDLGFLTLCVLLQEIGRAVAPVPVLPSLALGALALERFASDAQKQQWLPGVVTGDVILSAALLEEGNDDATRPTVEARGDALSGVKICVPAAQLATRILVPARKADGSCGLWLLDPAADGVTLEDQKVTSKQPHARLVLENAPAERIGEADGAADSVAWLVDRATLATCIVQVGVSERALEMTSEYAQERVQFDRAIGSFQAVHQRAADAFIQLEAMRLTAWDAAWRLDAGLPAESAAASALAECIDASRLIGPSGVQILGGHGFMADYPVEKHMREARALGLLFGGFDAAVEESGREIVTHEAPLAIGLGGAV
jgi:alkylation response protein AidB-like acyl-CoA dehydrogenase